MEREVERRMERDERGRGEKRGRRQRRWWKKRNKRTKKQGSSYSKHIIIGCESLSK